MSVHFKQHQRFACKQLFMLEHLNMRKEIADKLQWYVQDGDTIVDFCCGPNDFSYFMKETLVAAGKKCFFKNYDIFSPKYDFDFEKRNWLEVQQNELPNGSQLIIGLNPPFGVKAALANKFIDKALSFKPKLVILLVPQETEGLDQKNPPYDLIWEDGGSLTGKSFFKLLCANEKQMEKPVPLYLWSREDWTRKHRAIASKHGHTTMDAPLPVDENVGKRQEAVTPRETKSNGMNSSNKRSPFESSKSGSPLPVDENVGKRRKLLLHERRPRAME